MERKQAINFLLHYPYKFAHLLGFKKLTTLHNDWIIEMVRGKEDKTIQGHRGCYKTTTDSVGIALIMILLPNKRILFMRKTDNDVKEVIRQVSKILTDPHTQVFVNAIYGVNLKLTTNSATELTTNLTTDIKGTAQLVGLGIGASITGKHFDFIFTDDIVNVEDRVSKAERERTKLMYQELQNIKNVGGKIFNTGTPWHKDDCFSIMPEAEKFDCYSTGLLLPEEIENIKSKMTRSLFAANYELRHIAQEDVIFDNPQTNGDPALAEQGIAHIDAAYGGEDNTALTIIAKKDGKYYIFGKLWHKHVEDCEDDIISLRKQFNAGKDYCEDNGDKGFLAKEMRAKGERVVIYHEKMNKFLKITSYLKAAWQDIVFVAGTDESYIQQICDYSENAEHDDAPDSAASAVRLLWNKSADTANYIPLWNK